VTHILKYSEWQSGSGRWYANDVENLAGISGKWWIPARMLGMSLTDYILLLKDVFNADIHAYNEVTDTLVFSWRNYNDAHRFVLWINQKARKAKYMVA